MANALKEIEHAQRLCDRGDITIGEYFDLVEKWEDAEPIKHGRLGENTYGYRRCSECEAAVRVEECMGEPIYSYCPLCGAKMDEVEE